MSVLLKQFNNGGKIEFDSGSFDDWCVYITKANGERFAPTDIQYFSRLKTLAEKYGAAKIYDDFVVIYNRTSREVDKSVFKLITALSETYNHDILEMEIWFAVIYAGMVAEENKKNAVLKKRIKRLGMYQLLVEDCTPEFAATFSKGKKWRELDKVMLNYNF